MNQNKRNADFERILTKHEAKQTKLHQEIKDLLQKLSNDDLKPIVQELKTSIKKTKEQLEQI